MDGWPAPHLAIFTDSELRHTVTSSDRVLVSAGADDEDPAVFTLMMRIQNVITADQGTYYCHANNTLGEASKAVELQVNEIYYYLYSNPNQHASISNIYNFEYGLRNHQKIAFSGD